MAKEQTKKMRIRLKAYDHVAEMILVIRMRPSIFMRMTLTQHRR